MNQITINANGAICWFAPKPCDRLELAAELTSYGVAHYTPGERTTRSALENALKDYSKENCPAQNYLGEEQEPLVRPLKKPGENGFEVCHIVRGKTANTHSHQYSVKADENGNLITTSGWCDLTDVHAKFTHYKQTLTGESVGQCLVKLATRHLNGITLRKAGGVYWIPNHELEQWAQLSQAVCKVSGSEVTTGMLEANEETMAAVRDGLMDQLRAEANEIMADLSSGVEHTPEWYDKRRNMAAKMKQRIESIESATQESLEGCHTVQQMVDGALMTASMATL